MARIIYGTKDNFIDIREMYVAGLLKEGVEFTEHEAQKFIKQTLKEIIRNDFK